MMASIAAGSGAGVKHALIAERSVAMVAGRVDFLTRPATNFARTWAVVTVGAGGLAAGTGRRHWRGFPGRRRGGRRHRDLRWRLHANAGGQPPPRTSVGLRVPGAARPPEAVALAPDHVVMTGRIGADLLIVAVRELVPR